MSRTLQLALLGGGLLVAVLVGAALLMLAGNGRVVTQVSPEEMTAIARRSSPSPIAPAEAVRTTRPAEGVTTPEEQLTSPTAPAPASPTVVAPSATPSPVPLQAEAPLLYDDFAAVTSGWAALDLDGAGGFNGYSSGSYRLDVAGAGQLRYDILPQRTFGNGRYAVDLQYEGGTGSFGVMLAVQGDPEQYSSLAFYRLALTSQGDITLSQMTGGQPALALATIPGAVRISPAQTVHIEVRAGAQDIDVFVEGNLVLTAPVTHIPAGQIGFFAEAEAQPLSVRFDNLIVTGAWDSPQAACATVRVLPLPSPAQLVAGEDVWLVEQRLGHLGYPMTAVDGVYDDDDAEVVRVFQQQNSLPSRGIIDSDTWCHLLASDARLPDGQTELNAEVERYARVQLTTPLVQAAPLLISMRQADTTWRVGFILPGQDEAHVIETAGDAYDPALASDGRTLAFTSDRSGTPAIWMLSGAGRLEQISSPTTISQFPAWSPDGRYLLYTAEPQAGGGLAARNYIYDRQSRETRLFSDEHTGWSRWSVQNELLFTRWSGTSFDLFRSFPDGTGLVNLTNTDAVDEDIASWSPDGSRIAFVINPRGDSNSRQIAVMNRDGSGYQQITSMVGPNSNPTWSPDGRMIAYANRPNATLWQIWLVDSTGGPPTQLSLNNQRVWFMRWMPVQ